MMLIHWKSSPNELDRVEKSVLGLAVSELVRAHRLGYHIVSIARHTAAWILDNVELSALEHSQIQNLSREYTQTGALCRRAKTYIEIHAGGADYTSNGGNAVGMSIEFIGKNDVLRQPKLIVENIDNDGWLIGFIFNNLKRLIGIPVLNLETVHGGGGDFVRVLPTVIESKGIGCLIVDSDKDSPLSRTPDKVSQAIDICSGSPWPLCFVHILPCREAENIVPLNVLSMLNNGASNASCTFLAMIEESEALVSCNKENKYRLYFDIKLGVDDEALSDMDAGDADWHREKLGYCGMRAGSVLLPGFGERVLQQMRNNNSIAAAFKTAVSGKAWQHHFLAFFEAIMWVFAAQKRSIT